MISHIQKHRRLRIQGSYLRSAAADTNNISCQQSSTPEDLLFLRTDLERPCITNTKNQQQDEIRNSTNRRRRARSSSVVSREETNSSTVVTPRSCRDEREKDLLEMIDELLHQGPTSK